MISSVQSSQLPRILPRILRECFHQWRNANGNLWHVIHVIYSLIYFPCFVHRLNVVSFVIDYYVKITQTFMHVMRNPCQMPVFCYTIVMMLSDLYKLAHFVYENIYSIGRITSLYFHCCCGRCCCCCCCCCFICLVLYLLNETRCTLIRRNKNINNFFDTILKRDNCNR